MEYWFGWFIILKNGWWNVIFSIRKESWTVDHFLSRPLHTHHRLHIIQATSKDLVFDQILIASCTQTLDGFIGSSCRPWLCASCAKCQTAFRHPPLQYFVFGQIRSPPMRTLLDGLGAPPFALWTCTIFEQSRAKSVGRLHLTPLRGGIWVQKRTHLLCDLLEATGQPPFAERDVYLV